jgi:hypothetical protein
MKTGDDILQILHGLKNEAQKKFKVKDFRVYRTFPVVPGSD